MDNTGLRQAGIAFESMMLEMVLRPLASGAGPLAECGVGALAGAVARADRSGFGALIASSLQSRAR